MNLAIDLFIFLHLHVCFISLYVQRNKTHIYLWGFPKGKGVSRECVISRFRTRAISALLIAPTGWGQLWTWGVVIRFLWGRAGRLLMKQSLFYPINLSKHVFLKWFFNYLKSQVRNVWNLLAKSSSPKSPLRNQMAIPI